MLLSAIIILFITLIFSFFAFMSRRKSRIGNNRIVLFVIFCFITCSLTLAAASLYTAIAQDYRSRISIDNNLLYMPMHLSPAPWHISRIYNITVALFMFGCMINVILVDKRKPYIYLPMAAFTLVFVCINDYRTSWSLYMYTSAHPSSFVNVLFDNIAAIDNFMLITYMAIPIITMLYKSRQTRLKFRKNYYTAFILCALLTDIYYLLILNVFFKGVSYKNISFAKLPKIQLAASVSSLSMIVGFILVFGITFIAAYYPFKNFLIVYKKEQALGSKNIGNNLNMIFHIYKNAFISVGRLTQTARENLDGGSADIVSGCLKTIEAIADEQLAIINKSLSLTRINDFSLHKINLNTVIREALEEIKIPAGIKLTFFPKTEDISILGDTYYLKESFKNMIENSVTALEKTDKNEKIISITTYIDSEFAIADIYDNGCGIEKKDIKKIFELYYSSKQKKECGGIGLHFVSNIINLHYGSIEVSGVPGTNTTFTIILPKK